MDCKKTVRCKTWTGNSLLVCRQMMYYSTILVDRETEGSKAE